MRRKLSGLGTILAAVAVIVPSAVAAATPAVGTGGHTSITNSSALLHGSVNPGGSGTLYYFQYGLTSGYGTQSPVHSAGSGTKTLAISPVRVSSLIPGTVYHYRLVASNRFGTAAGNDRTFTTTGHPPPYAATGPTLSVGSTFAVVSGVVNPNGQATSYYFQYGTSTSYGALTAPVALAASKQPSNVIGIIGGLSSGTTFHYRLIAVHGNSMSPPGADQTFTTIPVPRPVPRVHASTTPHRAQRKPYLFTTSGSIALPASIPASAGCNGVVAVRFFVGHRSYALRTAPVQANCTFASQVLFHRLYGGQSRRLRVEVRFRGNRYLIAASARPQRVRLG